MNTLDARSEADDAENDDEAPDPETYPLDRFLIIIQPLQRLFGFRYLNFKRVDGRFAFPKMRILNFVMFLVFVDIICYAVKICLEIRAKRLSEAQKIGAICSIEIFCFSRGLTLMLKQRDIAQICNRLDRMYPRGRLLQQRMRLPAIAHDVGRRFRYYYHYTTFAFVVFVGLPLVKYFRNRDLRIPVADEYHMDASWLPFGIKQSHRAYPFIFAYETYITMGAVSLVMSWDHMFTVIMSQLCMHFDMLGREVLRLNARDARDPAKAAAFFKRMRECLVYMQKLNKLGAEFNSIFNLSILISDRIAALAICLLICFMSNSEEWFERITYSMPCSICIWLNFDISKQGTQLETLTGNIRTVLYEHNWFEGSLEYRRYVIMWMQHANEPFKLTAFKMFEVNMAHFQETMLLAYQMFTFLQSRK